MLDLQLGISILNSPALSTKYNNHNVIFQITIENYVEVFLLMLKRNFLIHKENQLNSCD